MNPDVCEPEGYLSALKVAHDELWKGKHGVLMCTQRDLTLSVQVVNRIATSGNQPNHTQLTLLGRTWKGLDTGRPLHLSAYRSE